MGWGASAVLGAHRGCRKEPYEDRGTSGTARPWGSSRGRGQAAPNPPRAPPAPGSAQLHPSAASPRGISSRALISSILFFFSKELKLHFKGRRGAAASQRDREERTRARRLSFFRALRALPDLSHQARAGVGQVSAPAAPWQGMSPFNLSGVTPFRFPLSSSFPLKTRILRG